MESGVFFPMQFFFTKYKQNFVSLSTAKIKRDIASLLIAPILFQPALEKIAFDFFRGYSSTPVVLPLLFFPLWCF